MKRISAARCGSLPSSRARLSTSVREAPGVPSAPNASLWNSRTGSVRPLRVFRSRSSTSVLSSPGAARSVVSSAAPSPATRSASFKPAGADLRQILVEPIGQRGVEIDHVALGIDGKKAGRGVIEIIDGVLQFLKDILLPLALARHVGQRPDGQAPVAAAFAERPHAQPQPARRPALDAGDPHFLLQALALARRLEQPVDRFGGVGVADEHALDRPHVVCIRRVDQIEIGGIGVDDAAVAIGDENAVEGVVDQRS